MNVTVRKMKLKDGNYSLFLDITGEGKRRRQYLGYKIIRKPTGDERDENKKYLQLAEDAASKLRLDLRTADAGLDSVEKKNRDFVQYCRDFLKGYNKKDARVVDAALKMFEKFLLKKGIRHLRTRDLTPVFCEDFGNYLKDEAGLNHETPQNYFKKFRMILIRARKEKLTNLDTREVHVKFTHDPDAIRKPLLSIEEIEKLMSTTSTQLEISRAFVYSLNTGLDYVTLHEHLYGRMIQGRYIVFDRSKTGQQNRIKMNETAFLMIADRIGQLGPDELVFKLPTHAACLASIRKWAKRAGITKKITWHSARHSVATNLINDFNVNPAVIQKLLGHKNLKTTMRYVKVREKAKDAAVDQLPSMKFPK